METQGQGQSGYYQTIAREFFKRRGAPFILSPRDQAMIAAWEKDKVPLRVVLEGISRAFDNLRARAGGTKGITLAYCGRQVEAAMAQHKDRTCGGRSAACPRPGKKDRVRREVEKALQGLPPEDRRIARLLQTALEALSAPETGEAELERIDGEVEEILWNRATAEEKAAAEAEARREIRSRPAGGLEVMVRRKVVLAARNTRKIPYVSPYYY